MPLNTLKCNHLTPLSLKGLRQMYWKDILKTQRICSCIIAEHHWWWRDVKLLYTGPFSTGCLRAGKSSRYLVIQPGESDHPSVDRWNEYQQKLGGKQVYCHICDSQNKLIWYLATEQAINITRWDHAAWEGLHVLTVTSHHIVLRLFRPPEPHQLAGQAYIFCCCMMHCGYFDTTRKGNHSATLIPTAVGGRRPLSSKICAQRGPPPSKNADFDRFPIIMSQP